MSENPMSLFSRSAGKKPQQPSAQTQTKNMSDASPTPIIPLHSSPSNETPHSEAAPSATLPPNWRDKVSEICHFLDQIRQQGAQIPQRQKMSDHEFEAFMNNPANFSSDDWNLVCQARERSRHFVQQMKHLLKEYKPTPKKPKKRKEVSRGWISID